jgi:hypothetical protein
MSNRIKRLRQSIAIQNNSLKNVVTFVLKMNYHLQQILIISSLVASLIVTLIVMLLRIDTKYSMFTGEFASKIAYLSMDISIAFLWIVTIIGVSKLIDMIQSIVINFKEDLNYGK